MMKLIWGILFFLSVGPLEAQVAVIANKSVPIDTLKKAELLDYYAYDKKSWSDGTAIVVFDLKPRGEVTKSFYKFLGKSTSRMKSIWMKKLLTGEGDPPVAQASEEKMLRQVAATPGAIGFVSAKKVNDRVKTLLIISPKK